MSKVILCVEAEGGERTGSFVRQVHQFITQRPFHFPTHTHTQGENSRLRREEKDEREREILIIESYVWSCTQRRLFAWESRDCSTRCYLLSVMFGVKSRTRRTRRSEWEKSAVPYHLLLSSSTSSFSPHVCLLMSFQQLPVFSCPASVSHHTTHIRDTHTSRFHHFPRFALSLLIVSYRVHRVSRQPVCVLCSGEWTNKNRRSKEYISKNTLQHSLRKRIKRVRSSWSVCATQRVQAIGCYLFTNSLWIPGLTYIHIELMYWYTPLSTSCFFASPTSSLGRLISLLFTPCLSINNFTRAIISHPSSAHRLFSYHLLLFCSFLLFCIQWEETESHSHTLFLPSVSSSKRCCNPSPVTTASRRIWYRGNYCFTWRTPLMCIRLLWQLILVILFYHRNLHSSRIREKVLLGCTI